jgi:hypothetical protein
MSVSSSDWDSVADLCSNHFPTAIPCFGIHPWKAHLHSSAVTRGVVADTLEGFTADNSVLRRGGEVDSVDLSAPLIQVIHSPLTSLIDAVIDCLVS